MEDHQGLSLQKGCVEHESGVNYFNRKQKEFDAEFNEIINEVQVNSDEDGIYPLMTPNMCKVIDHDTGIKLGYSRLIIRDNGVIKPVYLLNSASREELEELGLTNEDIRSYQSVEKGLILGKGAFGKVTPAVLLDPVSGRLTVVAVKKEKLHGWNDIKAGKKERAKSHFYENIACEASLQIKAGASTVKTYGVIQTEDKAGVPTALVVMDVAKGDTLENILYPCEDCDENPLNVDQRYEMAIDLSKKLQSLHFKGLPHLDLKPNNVIYDKKNKSKIIDFGASEDMACEDRLPAKYVTSKKYLAPEIMADDFNPYKADIYSLGIILFQLLGQYPSHDLWYEDCEQADISRLYGEVIDWGEASEIPDESIGELVKMMVDPDPSKRPELTQIVSRLEDVLDKRKKQAAGIKIRSVRPCKRKIAPHERDLVGAKRKCLTNQKFAGDGRYHMLDLKPVSQRLARRQKITVEQMLYPEE